MTPQELNTRLAQELAAFPGKAALCMTDAATGAVLHSFAADTVVTSASTIKTTILLAALDRVAAGRLDLSAPIPLDPAAILPDTAVFEPENPQTAFTLWELLYWMMVNSDNTATNAVLDLVGFDAVNAYAAGSLTLTGTRCRRKMLDFAAQAAGRDNVTTAADQCRMFGLLCRRAILTSPLLDIALDLLQRQRAMSSFLRYIPHPIPCAHKTGGLDHVSHDCGLLWLDERCYALSILTWDGPALDGQPQQKRFIGRLTRLIYDTYKEAPQ